MENDESGRRQVVRRKIHYRVTSRATSRVNGQMPPTEVAA